MGIAEREGGSPVFENVILKVFLQTAETTAQLLGKIGRHIPTVEVLTLVWL